MLVAAKVAKKSFEVVNQQPPANRFPFGHTPALEDGQLSLFGADAIAKYLTGNNTEYNPQVRAFLKRLKHFTHLK